MHINQNNIDGIISWLLNSGIQNPAGFEDMNGVSLSGSFNAWFDLEKKTYSYIYIEISGYALTALLYLFKAKKEDVFLQRARVIGDWLLSVQDEHGAFPTAFYHYKNDSPKPKEIHTFDVGMVFNGLALLYRETKKERYLIAAEKAAGWALAYQQLDGSITAQIDKETQDPHDSEKTWSTQSGPYHAKLAIGLLNIFDLIGNKIYKNAAIKLCDYALTKQNPDGQFLTYGNLSGTNVHPHTYAIEGLYVAGSYINEERYIHAARRGILWALAHRKNGIVPRHKHNDTFNYNERIDILAQVLRMACLLNIKDKNLELIKRKILHYQYNGNITSQRGGIAFGKQSDGTPAPHINSWVTMFAVQALMVCDQESLSSLFLLV